MTAYKYPRTVAEMIPARRAEIAAHPVPDCGRGHGPMDLHPLEGQSYEQMFCGVWYTCRDPHCGSGVLYRSRELAHQCRMPYHDGAQWHQYDGTGWAEITDEEAGEFWRRLETEHEARSEQMRRVAAARKRTRKTQPAALF